MTTETEHLAMDQPGPEPAAPPPDPPRAAPALVPAQVSAAKLAAELADWDTNDALYRRRGWLLLERAEQHVVVAFIAVVPIMATYTLPVIAVCVRIDYSNYDLWPPSVAFVDPRTREPAMPAVRAVQMQANGEPRDALVEGHPDTGLPFLCLPGVREYHHHPQHSGDDWLLHRASGAGRLAVICERIWQLMIRTVFGLGISMQTLPLPLGTQLQVALAQGNPETLPQPQQAPQPPPPSGGEPAVDATPGAAQFQAGTPDADPADSGPAAGTPRECEPE